MELKIVCISDTHGLHRQMPPIPPGDVLVHAGDCLGHGTEPELREFLGWFAAHPHKHKVLVAGNHDWIFERAPYVAQCLCQSFGVTYLQDEGTMIQGIRFWGSPWQPWFHDWAFNLPRSGEALRRKWFGIPDRTDVLITHGPPHGIMDLAPDPGPGRQDRHVGCELLRDRLWQVRPQLHVFGHIHEGYGILETECHSLQTRTTLVNAAICDANYRPVNKPIVQTVSPRVSAS